VGEWARGGEAELCTKSAARARARAPPSAPDPDGSLTGSSPTVIEYTTYYATRLLPLSLLHIRALLIRVSLLLLPLRFPYIVNLLFTRLLVGLALTLTSVRIRAIQEQLEDDAI